MNELDIVIRRGTPDDLAFAATSWFESFRGSQTARPMDYRTYRKRWITIIRRLLSRCELMIATPPDEADKDIILGWIAFETLPETGQVLHYLYTKLDFRRSGVASRLIRAAGLTERYTYTHDTSDFRLLWNPERPRPIYDPTRIFEAL